MSRKMCKIMLLSYICLFLSVFVKNSEAADLKSFGDFAEAIGNLFGSSDTCTFQCPNGATPTSNPHSVPDANGCGSYGFQLDVSSMPGMTECCNQHDYCYDGCNNDKSMCDRNLKHCLQRVCYRMEDEKERKMKRDAPPLTWHYDPNEKNALDCTSLVQMIYGGVSTLGCDAYITAQEAACSCPAAGQKQRRSWNGNRRR